MRVRDPRRLDAVDRAEVLVVMPPARHLLVEQLLHRLGDPRCGMHAVGDELDVIVREHLLRHLAVLHRHAVHPAREAQRHVRHVQQVVVQAAKARKRVRALIAQNRIHLVEPELVVPGGNRRMRREHALLRDGQAVGLGCSRERCAGRQAIFQAAPASAATHGPRSCDTPRVDSPACAAA